MRMLLLACTSGLFACTGPSTGADDSGTVADSAPTDPPDPSVYDCTATEIPARTNPLPYACATDRTCTDRLVTGHRGMGGEMGVIAPEDTLAAVRANIAYGADYVETDPRPTADGVLVNMHDTSVNRTTDGTGEVLEMTYAEIQTLHVLADAYPGDFGCEHVPTLQEVLATAKGRTHVLVDANKTDRVDLLVAAITETDTLDDAIFDTSDPAKIAAALAIAPTLHTMIRVETTDELATELATFADHPPVIVEIPHGEPDLPAAVLAAGHRPFTDVFLTDAPAAYNDDPSMYAAEYETGVVILESDRPDLVLRYLDR
jgi:glycerophosphoryl diester phosphodiesterase